MRRPSSVDALAEFGRARLSRSFFMRDFLYVDNQHGAPWDDVWDWYSAWLPDLRHRSDFNQLLDMVSGDYVARNIACLAEDGRHVTIAVLGGLKAEINMATVMRKRLSLTGSTLRPRSNEFKALLADEIYNHAWPLFQDGTILPIMDRTFPLADAGAAHARMEGGDHIGKIVLEVADG